MKKYIIIITLIVGFLASPYILDYFQWKSALEAAGGASVNEGIVSGVKSTCTCTTAACAPCAGIGMCTAVSACLAYQGLTVTQSAGGMPCKSGYVLTQAQAAIVQDVKNIIVGGTICTNLSIVASGKGCLGCNAMINNQKIYAFKNKTKEIIDNFIIAGKKLFE